MDRWMTFLRDHTVLSEKEIKEMTTDYSENKGIHYGYGFMIESDGDFGHEGAIDSYLTHEFTSPKEKYNLFIATNNDNYNKLSSLAQFVKKSTR